MISIIKQLFGSRDDESDHQLWIMIRESDFFRSEEHLSIIDELSDLVEEAELGELDGHSSGAYQLEINFFDVKKFEKAKNVIESYLKQSHPEIEFHISDDYETTYEQR